MSNVVDLKRYAPIAEGIARLLHPFAEVVLHDIEESRIVAIYGSFSKRGAGDESLIRDREGLARGTDVHGPFRRHDLDRPWIKYVSIKLKDDDGRAIGLMCINLDVSVVAELKQSMLALLTTEEDSSDFESLFDDDWQEQITTFVQEHLQSLNRSPGSLTRRERSQLVRELQGTGVLHAKNAPAFVANLLGVSRATIYNDLAHHDDAAPEPRGAD
jgi:predicted transcriptional regulator YheO